MQRLQSSIQIARISSVGRSTPGSRAGQQADWTYTNQMMPGQAASLNANDRLNTAAIPTMADDDSEAFAG